MVNEINNFPGNLKFISKRKSRNNDRFINIAL